MNSLLGQTLSIVTEKAQTTRHKVRMRCVLHAAVAAVGAKGCCSGPALLY